MRRKVIPAITIILACTTLGSSIWAGLAIGLYELMGNTQQKSSDTLPTTYYQMLLSSSILAAVGALTQLVTSIITMRTDPRIIYSRLRLWETINVTVTILFMVAAIMPFLTDPRDNSNIGIAEFLIQLRENIVQFIFHAKEIPQIIPDLLNNNFTPFYLLLCTNINASIILLTVNLFCMCDPKKSLARKKDPDQKVPEDFFSEGSLCHTLNQSIKRDYPTSVTSNSLNHRKKYYI